MRRLVGLLVIGVLVITGVAVAVAPAGARRVSTPAAKLSPVPAFFSLLAPRPQKPKTVQVLPPSESGYSCPAATTGSRCSRIPCNVFVAPGSPATFHLVPGSPACTGAASPIARATPVTSR